MKTKEELVCVAKCSAKHIQMQERKEERETAALMRQYLASQKGLVNFLKDEAEMIYNLELPKWKLDELWSYAKETMPKGEE